MRHSNLLGSWDTYGMLPDPFWSLPHGDGESVLPWWNPKLLSWMWIWSTGRCGPAVSQEFQAQAPAILSTAPNISPIGPPAAVDISCCSTFIRQKLIGTLSFYFGHTGQIIYVPIFYKGYLRTADIRSILINMSQSAMQEKKRCSSETGDDKFEEIVRISKLIPLLLSWLDAHRCTLTSAGGSRSLLH